MKTNKKIIEPLILITVVIFVCCLSIKKYFDALALKKEFLDRLGDQPLSANGMAIINGADGLGSIAFFVFLLSIILLTIGIGELKKEIKKNKNDKR